MNDTVSDIAQIQRYISERFLPEVEPEAVDPEFDLVSGGVVDSLGLVQLITWLSTAFGIDIDRIPIAPDNFRSVRAIHDFVADARRHAA